MAASSMPAALVASVAAWCVSSAVFSTYFNSAFMLEFRRFESAALALTLIRFVGSAVIGLSSNAVGLVVDRPLSLSELAGCARAFALPSFLLVSANLFNSIALGLTGITITYVTKAGIPLVTVVICLFQGQKIKPMVMLTMIPIVLGVALSAWSDVQFNPWGLVAAIISTVSQAFLNTQSKVAISSTRLTGAQAQMVLVSAASVLLSSIFAVAYFFSGPGVEDFPLLLQSAAKDEHAGFVLLGAAVAYHVEYVLNFIVTGTVSSVAFSVIDVSRRLAIVVVGALLFSKPLTMLNLVGCVLALGGVLGFSLIIK